MELITGDNISNRVDYSFGDHMGANFTPKIPNGFMKYANAHNYEFLAKAKEFEGKVMTLYIDNIRLYYRPITIKATDKDYITWLFMSNDLLKLCSLLPKNKFIIFTGQEDTPIDDKIQLPFNVLKIYACNALYNTERIIPFPIGLQRKMLENDNRLDIMKSEVEAMELCDKRNSPQRVKNLFNKVPTKLLYINCGVERNPERLPLLKFESNSWCTTRFDKDSKFFPYDRYNEFLSELRDHKFVACPKGHGYDTHRIWETLYMRRVPVMLDDPYFRILLKDFPVLFISDWNKLTSHFLNEMYQYYNEAQTMDLNKLNLETIYNEIRINI